MGQLGECKQQEKCPNCMLRTNSGMCTILEKGNEFSKPCSFYKTLEQSNKQDEEIARFYRNNPKAVSTARNIISESNMYIDRKHNQELKKALANSVMKSAMIMESE